MKKLQVPENIPLRWEAWRGIGWPEIIKSLAITGIVLAGAIVFCFASDINSDKLIAVVAVSFAFATCLGVFGKLDNNQSIYDFCKRQLSFKREQQQFEYLKREGVFSFAEEKDGR